MPRPLSLLLLLACASAWAETNAPPMPTSETGNVIGTNAVLEVRVTRESHPPYIIYKHAVTDYIECQVWWVEDLRDMGTTNATPLPIFFTVRAENEKGFYYLEHKQVRK